MNHINKKALVLFSGGQDSTTCLGWSLTNFSHVITIGFNYGQRHSAEMQCRNKVLHKISRLSKSWEQRLGEDYIFSLDIFSQLGETAMTSELKITFDNQGLPNTFVPGRNILFLTVAAAFAWRENIHHLIIGTCETDFSGYPDCQDNTMKATQLALSLGLGGNITIHTPLMWLTKAQTWELALQLGGSEFLEIIRHETHSCYLNDYITSHEWGHGCGTCPACKLRKNGWEIFLTTKKDKPNSYYKNS